MRMMTRSWNFTLTTWSKCCNFTVTIVAKTWNGIVWLTEWVLEEVALMAEWIWAETTWLDEGIWDRATWLAEWVWDKLIWLGERIWDGITWTGKPFVPVFNYVIHVVAKFYSGYLESKGGVYLKSSLRPLRGSFPTTLSTHKSKVIRKTLMFLYDTIFLPIKDGTIVLYRLIYSALHLHISLYNCLKPDTDRNV